MLFWLKYVKKTWTHVRYVVRKERSILITFLDNYGYFSLILKGFYFVNLTSGSFFNFSCLLTLKSVLPFEVSFFCE